MVGIVLKYLGKTYKFGQPDSFTSFIIVMTDDRVQVEGFATIKFRPGIEFEIEIAEIDEATPEASRREAYDLYSDWVMPNETEWKLERYRKLKEVLTNERLI